MCSLSSVSNICVAVIIVRNVGKPQSFFQGFPVLHNVPYITTENLTRSLSHEGWQLSSLPSVRKGSPRGFPTRGCAQNWLCQNHTGAVPALGKGVGSPDYGKQPQPQPPSQTGVSHFAAPPAVSARAPYKALSTVFRLSRPTHEFFF